MNIVVNMKLVVLFVFILICLKLGNCQPDYHGWNISDNLIESDSELKNIQCQSYSLDNDNLTLAVLLQENYDSYDMLICDEMILFTNDNAFYLQPLTKNKLNRFGLYQTKLMYQIGKNFLNSRRSAQFDSDKKRLYYSDGNRIQVISVCDLIPDPKVVIERQSTIQIKQIQLDIVLKMILWIEKDMSNYRIMKSNLVGEEQVQLFESINSECAAMSIDVEQNSLYWLDNTQLYKMDYNSQTEATAERIFQNQLLVTDRIRIIGRYLYWTMMSKSLLRCDIQSTNKKVEYLINMEHTDMTLTSFDLASYEAKSKCQLYCDVRNINDNNSKGIFTHLRVCPIRT